MAEKVERIKTTCLPVGQGMGYLLECYNGQGQLIFLGLFDFGSRASSESRINIEMSYRYLNQKMQERMQVLGNAGGYYLDLITISHQDDDHWSLLNHMLSVPLIYSIKTEDEDSLRYTQITREEDENKVSIAKQRWIYSKTSSLPEISYFQWELYPRDCRFKAERSVRMEGGILIVDTRVVFDDEAVGVSCDNYLYLLGKCMDVSPLVQLQPIEWESNQADKIVIRGMLRFEQEGQGVVMQRLTVHQGSEIVYKEEYQGGYNGTTWVKLAHNASAPDSFIRLCPYPSAGEESLSEEEQEQLLAMEQYINGCTSWVEDGNYVIREVLLGGEPAGWEWKSRMAFEALSWLSVECMQLSGFASMSNVRLPVDLDNMKVYLLCCLSRSGLPEELKPAFSHAGTNLNDDDIGKNFSSAVMLILFEGKGILFPGDMTVHTAVYLLQYAMERPEEQPCTHYKSIDADAANVLLAVPHHGSDRTMRGGYAQGQEQTFAVFENFMKVIAPVYTHASSGFKDSNKHPREEVARLCQLYTCFDDPNGHFYYSPEFKGSDCFQPTNKGFYTTVMDPVLCGCLPCEQSEEAEHPCAAQCASYPCDNCVYKNISFCITADGETVNISNLWE